MLIYYSHDEVEEAGGGPRKEVENDGWLWKKNHIYQPQARKSRPFCCLLFGQETFRCSLGISPHQDFPRAVKIVGGRVRNAQGWPYNFAMRCSSVRVCPFFAPKSSLLNAGEEIAFLYWARISIVPQWLLKTRVDHQ